MAEERYPVTLCVAGLVGAGVWAIVGVMGIADVRGLLGGVDIELTSRDSLNEARAVYGGLMLAIAGVQAALAMRAGWRRLGVGLWTVLLAGLVGGRLWSVALDGWPVGMTRGLLAIEAAGFLVGAALWTFTQPRRPKRRAS